jgi:hypothetical protein
VRDVARLRHVQLGLGYRGDGLGGRVVHLVVQAANDFKKGINKRGCVFEKKNADYMKDSALRKSSSSSTIM